MNPCWTLEEFEMKSLICRLKFISKKIGRVNERGRAYKKRKKKKENGVYIKKHWWNVNVNMNVKCWKILFAKFVRKWNFGFIHKIYTKNVKEMRKIQIYFYSL